MRSIKRILVATDFSEHAQFAVTRAIELANINHASLTILHVAKKGFLEKMIGKVVPVVGKVLITPEEYAVSLLKKQINISQKNKIKINFAILSGEHPAPKILKYANDHGYHLLVLGAHGKYAIHDWFVGTTAEYAAKKTRMPVLIVKNAPKKPYQNILVPIDFSALSKDTVRFADQFFPKSNLHLLHVGDHHYENFLNNSEDIPKEKLKEIRDAILFSLSEKTKNFIKSSGVKLKNNSPDIKMGYPGSVIVDEAKKRHEDIVVMGTEGHSARHYLFIGRVANLVLMEIDRDILLVPPKNKGKKLKKRKK